MKRKDSEIVGQLIMLAFGKDTDVTVGECLDLYKRMLLAEEGGPYLAAPKPDGAGLE